MTDVPPIPPQAPLPPPAPVTTAGAQTPPPSTQAAPQPPVPATIVTLPDLPQLPPRLEGRIVAQTPPETAPQSTTTTITLRTPVGDITLTLPSPLPQNLPKNAPVTLLLPPQAKNGGAAQILLPKLPAVAALPLAEAPRALVPLKPGDVFTAYPLPAAQTAPGMPGLVRIGAGDIAPLLQLLGDEALPLLQSLLPEVSQKTLLSLFQGPTPLASFNALPASAQGSVLSFFSLWANQQGALPPAATPLPQEPQPKGPQLVTIEAPFIPPVRGPAVPPAPGLTLAEITGTTPTGRPIFKTDTGLFVLDTDQSLPPDTKVWVKTAPLPAAQETALKKLSAFAWPDLSAPGALAQSKKWPALLEALDRIRLQNGALAQVLQQSLPGPATPARLVPAVLFFMAALKTGNVQDWLGKDTIDLLIEGDKKDIAARLTRDFARLGQSAAGDGDDGWKAFSLPMRHDGEISQIQLFVRHPTDDDAQKDAQDTVIKRTTRFILNLSLSRLGDMQIDGYFKKKNLDIILRTEQPLTAAMRQDVLRHYADGLKQGGLTGGLSFQTRHEHWVAAPVQP